MRMIRLPKAVHDNLIFLIAETSSQLEHLERFVLHGDTAAGRRVLDRAGYGYNLRSRIQKACWDSQRGKRAMESRVRLQSIESVAQDLDHITESAREAVRQLSTRGELRVDESLFKPIFKHLQTGLALIPRILESAESAKAIKLGRLTDKIFRRHQKIEAACIAEVKKSRADDFAAVLLAAHAFEQMGQSLFDISEALLSAVLGQAINLARYDSLESLGMELDSKNQAVSVKTVAETRSGSSISGIVDPETDRITAIFKDGERKKLKEERDGFQSWHDIYPGLAPKVLSYKRQGDSAALLIEHLNGMTLEHLLLNESYADLDAAFNRLGQTLRRVWKETREKRPARAGFMDQLHSRWSDILSVHPNLSLTNGRIGALPVRGLKTLVARAKSREVPAPFSVYIHGDFNLDNILYDSVENRISFIDVHRSRQMDYVQDISVFMVSCYRLQVLERPERDRILALALRMAALAKRFAKREGDDTFEFRLALGLARSLITSTRFILDPTLTDRMILRARYILERIDRCPEGGEARFKLPLQELFYE